MKTKNFQQTRIFHALPIEVYDLIMSSKKHTKFSGAYARIGTRAGRPFTAYDGFIEGVNLEIIPARLIVQQWRTTEWPKGHYSTVRFEFQPENGFTKLLFTQTGIPVDELQRIKEGWERSYWKPMEAMLKGKKYRTPAV